MTTSSTTVPPPAATARRKRTAEERRARDEAKADRAERREQLRTLAALAAQSPALGLPMPSTPGPSVPCTSEVGATAEDRAVAMLEALGYDIVERNFKCKLGELDVIAIDGDVMVFIEVRFRADDSCGDAVETVTRRKQAKVRRVAEIYLLDKRPAFAEYRFDVVAINGDRIDHYVDAWRGGLVP